MSRKDQDCRNCGAPREAGAGVCPYCGTVYPDQIPNVGGSVPYAKPITPGRAAPDWQDVARKVATDQDVRRPDAVQWRQIAIFFLLIFFCQPVALLYMWSHRMWSITTRVTVTILVLGWWTYFIIAVSGQQ
ncbi:MAG: hypothetical protein H6684_13290 [Deltaproteobacteria bacterium]|nr:hypothetical protein [bacterium]MCB9479900.1 hypothetical protein [Deltaproteobacteria bacterium]MCB9489701.1 hypothetical protein [Deltaproteobacteria bacterium]